MLRSLDQPFTLPKAGGRCFAAHPFLSRAPVLAYSLAPPLQRYNPVPSVSPSDHLPLPFRCQPRQMPCRHQTDAQRGLVVHFLNRAKKSRMKEIFIKIGLESLESQVCRSNILVKAGPQTPPAGRACAYALTNVAGQAHRRITPRPRPCCCCQPLPLIVSSQDADG